MEEFVWGCLDSLPWDFLCSLLDSLLWISWIFRLFGIYWVVWISGCFDVQMFLFAYRVVDGGTNESSYFLGGFWSCRR